MASFIREDQIEKDIKFSRYSPRSPHFQMKQVDLWPNVERMHEGDVYVIEYDHPKALQKNFKRICVEKTGKTLKENDLVVHVMAKKQGIIILKL